MNEIREHLSQWAIVLRVAVLLAAFGICLQVTLMLISRWHPLLGLATHFTFHSLLGGLISLPVLLAIRAHKAACLVGVALLCNLLVVRPWQLIPRELESPKDLANTVSVFSWNVYESNPFPEAVEQLIRSADADVVVLLELPPGLLEELDWVTQNYPHRLALPEWSGRGIGVFSRLPGTLLERRAFGYAQQPGIVATIPAVEPSGELQLVGFHPLSPLPVRRARIRNKQLRAFTAWATEQQGPVCLCGDLNITPWDHPFQLVLASGFRDSRVGTGNCATWPAKFGLLGLPIDHALSNARCLVRERRVLPNAPGSDHRPLRFLVHY